VHLKLGLAVVLVWVGLKMLLLEVWKVPTLLSLAVIVTILTISVIASLRATADHGETAPPESGTAQGNADVVPIAAGPASHPPHDPTRTTTGGTP